MLKTIARWLGLDERSQKEKRLARGEAPGKEAFYPARDEAIRQGRKASPEELVTVYEAARTEAARRRGTPDYHAALGVMAGVEQVMREKGIRRVR